MFVIEKLKLLALVVICWIVFGVACLVSIFAFPAAILLLQGSYAARVLKSQDKLMAAVLGYRGDKTVSRECGESTAPSTFCRRIMRWIRLLDPKHFDRYQGEK